MTPAGPLGFGAVEAVESAATLRAKATEWRRAASMLTGLAVDQPAGNAEFVKRMASHCIDRANGHDRIADHLLDLVGLGPASASAAASIGPGVAAAVAAAAIAQGEGPG